MSERSSIVGRRVRTAVRFAFYAAALIIVALPVLLCGGFLVAIRSSSGPFRETVENPQADFTRATGLAWPEGARVVSVGDDHGGMMGDGEFHLVFDTDAETLEKWLTSPAPWQTGKWKRGPVPGEIGFHCNFGTSGVLWSRQDGIDEYWGDPELKELLGSSAIWYAAKERCCETLRWHNGHLLVIDGSKNRVWLSVWDF